MGTTRLFYVLFTEDERRSLHRTFGHPSVRASERLLRRATDTKLDQTTMEPLEKINGDCKGRKPVAVALEDLDQPFGQKICDSTIGYKLISCSYMDAQSFIWLMRQRIFLPPLFTAKSKPKKYGERYNACGHSYIQYRLTTW